MATKNYMINDKWLDLDKQNIVELQSVDGVLDSLKVNGSEIETPSGKITITENGTDIDIAQYALADVNVEGGGGSSDFSTAEVEINGIAEIYGAFLKEDETYYINSGTPTTIILYKGKATLMSLHAPQSVTGNISYDSDREEFTVTGDGTITFGGLGL